MYTVDLYLRVRLACHVDGLSQREAASRFGIARETVRKMLRHSEPPGYRRRQPPKRPKLAPFTDIVDRILEEDRTVHRKQHHTAKRIFERLRDEHGFTGKETIVKDYVRERRLRRREMFVPLSHPPGQAQADFGEADAIIAGVKYRAHFFVMTLPHSDACFVAAYPAATTEAWLDGHNRAYTAWIHRFHRYRELGGQLAPTAGSMGYGLPAAVAAKLVAPERPAVAFAGDGCFLMTAQELATAARHDLALVVVVVNNGMLGTIRMHQELRYPGRVIGTDLTNPDFCALARAFGAHAEKVERTQDFAPALARALEAGGPALIELVVDAEAISSTRTLSKIQAEVRPK